MVICWRFAPASLGETRSYCAKVFSSPPPPKPCTQDKTVERKTLPFVDRTRWGFFGCCFFTFYIYLCFFLQLYCPNGISPTGENSGCHPRGKPAATEWRSPTYSACWVSERFHNPPNSDMDYGILNVRTDINACDCTRRFTDTVRESALKVDSRRRKKKSLAAAGNRTCVGSVLVRCCIK